MVVVRDSSGCSVGTKMAGEAECGPTAGTIDGMRRALRRLLLVTRDRCGHRNGGAFTQVGVKSAAYAPGG